jgi:hypothetical protein
MGCQECAGMMAEPVPGIRECWSFTPHLEDSGGITGCQDVAFVEYPLVKEF